MLLVLPVLPRSLTADHDSWANLISRVVFTAVSVMAL